MSMCKFAMALSFCLSPHTHSQTENLTTEFITANIRNAPTEKGYLFIWGASVEQLNFFAEMNFIQWILMAFLCCISRVYLHWHYYLHSLFALNIEIAKAAAQLQCSTHCALIWWWENSEWMNKCAAMNVCWCSSRTSLSQIASVCEKLFAYNSCLLIFFFRFSFIRLQRV